MWLAELVACYGDDQPAFVLKDSAPFGIDLHLLSASDMNCTVVLNTNSFLFVPHVEMKGATNRRTVNWKIHHGFRQTGLNEEKAGTGFEQ